LGLYPAKKAGLAKNKGYLAVLKAKYFKKISAKI